MNFTNYYTQAMDLPVENEFQLTILRSADVVSTAREVSKMAIAVGIIATAVSPIFGYNPLLPVQITTAAGIVWLISHCTAAKLGNRAQAMLVHFREMEKERKNPMPLSEQRRLGLID